MASSIWYQSRMCLFFLLGDGQLVRGRSPIVRSWVGGAFFWIFAGAFMVSLFGSLSLVHYFEFEFGVELALVLEVTDVTVVAA